MRDTILEPGCDSELLGLDRQGELGEPIERDPRIVKSNSPRRTAVTIALEPPRPTPRRIELW